MKKCISLALVLALCLSLCACGKEAAKDEAVEKVISMINSLGNVSLASNTALENAENAYNALTDDQKAAVTNYNLLTTARATYKRIMNVYSLIEAIGTVTQESEEAIRAAEEAYNLLPERDRKHITNYDKLTAARAAFDGTGVVVTLDKDNFTTYFDFDSNCAVDKSEAGGTYSVRISGDVIASKNEIVSSFENVTASVRVHYSVTKYDGSSTVGSRDVNFTLSADTGSGTAAFNPGTFSGAEDYPNFAIVSFEVLSAEGMVTENRA